MDKSRNATSSSARYTFVLPLGATPPPFYSHGILVVGPMACGKSTALRVAVKWFLDGDELLKANNCPWQSRIWYDPRCVLERELALSLFETVLAAGFVIFYSCNPLYITPDIIINCDHSERWTHLRNREIDPTGNLPNWVTIRFKEEVKAYDLFFASREAISATDSGELIVVRSVDDAITRAHNLLLADVDYDAVPMDTSD